jgi:hypothetical protein
MPESPGRRSAARHAGVDVDQFLQPSGAFAHPHQVVDDPDLTLSEKRAILAAWAAEARVASVASALRKPAQTKPVTVEDIMDALREVEEQIAHDSMRRPHYRRVLTRRGTGTEPPSLS